MPFGARASQVQAFDALHEALMRLLVTLLAQRQSFFLDDRQRLMQRIEQRGRSGVMITVRDRQVIGDQ